MVSEISNLELIGTEDVDNFKEVTLKGDVDNDSRILFELKNYRFLVRFYDDGNLAFFLYDDDSDEIRYSIGFSPEVETFLLDFALKSLH